MRTDSQRTPPPVSALTAQHGESEEKALNLGPEDEVTEPLQTRFLAAWLRAVVEGINA